MVEEWRLRDQNFWGRYFTGVAEILLAGSAYADREPLGTPEEVAATTRDGLLEFYERWYRPDTMAVIAVGDFDADLIEDLIATRFAALQGPDEPLPLPEPATAAFPEPAFFVLADPEYPQAWAELNYPLPALAEPATIGTVRLATAFELAWDIVVARLEEQSLRGDAPFFDPSFAANPLVRGQRSPGLAAFADPTDLAAATEALLLEVRRARLHGFGPAEFARVVEERRALVELAYDERSTTQDAEYADRYVEHFLGGSPIPDADEWREVQLGVLDELTADLVADTFRASLDPTNPFVILVAPQADAAILPSEAELGDVVANVDGAQPDPWVDAVTTIDALMDRPEPAAVTDRGPFSDTGLTEITLANGTRVVFLPTTIRDDVVVVRAASPGGWATVAEDEATEAQLVSGIVTTSGIAAIDQIDLDRYLAGTNAVVAPFIDETTEGFSGEATTDDLEVLLQLIHLYMTEPRFDARAAEVVIAEILPFSSDLALVPDLAADTALAEARFGGDTRFRAVPTEPDLDTFDLEAAARLYRDRFDDPGDFVFAFVGDFSESSLEQLVRSYLGSIPGPGDADAFIDVRPPPPDGVTDLVVEAGSGVLGGVTFLFSTELTIDAATRVELDLLELVVQQRLTERIREELSASYSPFAFTTLIEDAEQSVEFQIQISGDPEGLDAVVAATVAEITDLGAGGPTDDELAIAAEQLRRDYELFSNEGLGQAILFSALHPGENLSQVTERIAQTGDASVEDIRELTAAVLPPDRYILVRLVPAA
jgi:zinc protease